MPQKSNLSSRESKPQLQESLNQDEDFAKTLTDILDKWKKLFCDALEKAINLGEIREDVEIEKVATFLIASIEGALLLAKKHQDKKDFEVSIEQLVFYINTLKK